MVRLLATIANDADYMPAHLAALSNDLTPAQHAESEDEVWGIGYYADRRALLIRKPRELLASPSFYDLSSDVQSRIVIATVSRGTEIEQSPPFRFRRWLFGSTGDLSPLEQMRERILDKLPEFIRTDADKGPGALAFGMFLAELHRANVLDDALIGPSVQRDALARTAEQIDGLSTEHSDTGVSAAYVASNGKALLVAGGGAPICHKEQRGLESLPEGPPDPALTDFKEIAGALKRFRAIVVACDVADPSGWNTVEKGQHFHVDTTLELASSSGTP